MESCLEKQMELRSLDETKQERLTKKSAMCLLFNPMCGKGRKNNMHIKGRLSGKRENH